MKKNTRSSHDRKVGVQSAEANSPTNTRCYMRSERQNVDPAQNINSSQSESVASISIRSAGSYDIIKYLTITKAYSMLHIRSLDLIPTRSAGSSEHACWGNPA